MTRTRWTITALAVLFVADVTAAGADVCPALSVLASSCRNGLCEAALGEDANTCPEDCADRSTQLTAYYTQAVTCPPTALFEPESIQELQDIIAKAMKNHPEVAAGRAKLLEAQANLDRVRLEVAQRIVEHHRTR